MMSIPGRVAVAARNRNSRSVDGQLDLIDDTECRSRNNCRDIAERGKIPLDESWTTTGARENDGQRPDRHQPSSLRARAEILLVVYVLWSKFFW